MFLVYLITELFNNFIQVWEGQGAVSTCRAILGETDPVGIVVTKDDKLIMTIAQITFFLKEKCIVVIWFHSLAGKI